MGFKRYTSPGSGTGNITTGDYKLDRIWVSCVGGGGGGGVDYFGYAGSNDVARSIAGGGGGWGYGAIPVIHTPNSTYSFSYTVGSGGSGGAANFHGIAFGGNGTNSFCLNIVATFGYGASRNSTGAYTGEGGPGGGYQIPQNAVSGGGSNGVSGENTYGRAGGAGNSGPCGGGNLSIVGNYGACNSPVFVTSGGAGVLSTSESCALGPNIVSPSNTGYLPVALSGANGNDGTGNTVVGNKGSITGMGCYDCSGDIPNSCANIVDSTGGSGVYGGGGNGVNGGWWSSTNDNGTTYYAVSTIRGGRGGDGVVYVSWVELSAPKTTISIGEIVAVSWSSPFGSGTDNVSFSSSGTQSYTKTDSKGAQSTIFFTVLPPVDIGIFYYTPLPQNSSTGVPQYSVTLSWSVDGGTTNYTHTITDLGTGQVYNNVSSGMTLSGLPQSVAGSLSPATTQVKLVSTDGFTSDEAIITIEVKNDNTPSNSWTTSFTGLEPNTEYQLQLGTLSGVDMNTIASSTTNNVFFGVPNGAFANPQIFTNNKVVALKCTTLPFNTNVTGETGQFGKVNTRTIPVVIGSNSFNVTVSTKKPVIREDFNYSDAAGAYPYTDIDLITNSPVEYTVTETISLDNIDIPVEILSDNPDVQIKINNGEWIYVREL